MPIDADKVTNIIREAAELDVMPRFGRLSDADIREKAPGDLVTVADIEAEQRITRALGELRPGTGVLAEEAASSSGLDLNDFEADDAMWLIDPVDGTANFSEGKTTFGMVVAYVESGIVEHAWIYLPADDRMIVAERGAGAWDSGGARLGVAAGVRLEELSGHTNFRIFDDVPPERVRENAGVFAELRNFRSASYDFVELSSGKKHFSLYRRLWPWDHAAGTLIFSEAGGYFARLDGRVYRPLQRVRGLLCAPDRAVWEAIRGHLSMPA